MTVLVVVLVCIATYRTTRLVVADAFPPTQALRAWVERRTGEVSSWSYLVNCPWCMSVYLGAAITAATALTVGLPLPALVWAASSATAGLLANVEDALSG